MLLIISNNKRIAKSIQETFHYMSILSYGATKHEAFSEISGIYRALLIVDPDSFPDINDYVNRIKSYNSKIPIFALSDSEEKTFYPDIFDKVFTRHSMTPLLASKIISYANQNNRAKIGDYRLAGIDASSNRVGVGYFDKNVGLTKTEAMILRYLIRSYPIPQNAEKIIKYAFKSSRAPEPASIRTHISVMNKKFETTFDKRLIVHAPEKGYLILTPEYEKILHTL